jgi:hypothetical protein
MNHTMEAGTCTQAPGLPFRKYEIGVESCNVGLHDPVAPETIIGRHFNSGLPVRAGLHGRIATMYFNPAHDSLLIMAVADSPN